MPELSPTRLTLPKGFGKPLDDKRGLRFLRDAQV